ncbi:glutamate racemase [Tamlana sp. s12]|uniref:glutamate racemase n=1 Tax=Tamlana sp. s12 TaxID=1630406 RepID=UPI0007FB9E27|nr:glutamate racemase [Tamlana sp. s12]OBQ57089.1 glutamate racemase [Tamlana sp. s12]QQY82731.1 glutamate racemase [Tamlana sp. s12]
MSKQPIGIFDSGVGGTSIWKEIQALLPHENMIYLADSKNAPYGPKGKQAIIDLSIKNTEYLIVQGCKLIVVACNTATTNAIDYLRKNYETPFIGIEPAIKPAALNSKTHTIGILATKGTLSSELFHKTAHLFASDSKIIEQEGHGIVELIEDGKLHSEAMTGLLEVYLKPMIDADIDYLVLGCTHYPYLIPILLKILPKCIKIIDSGEAVARQTKAVLIQHNLLNQSTKKGKSTLFTNANPQVITTLLGASNDISYLDF